MTRVYFDTNVFSQLESNTESKFQQLNDAIKLHKHNLSFFFSPAHIRDKRKADTEKKQEYFKFLETLVYDNHLSYNGLDKKCHSYLATPTMVYNNDDENSENLMQIFMGSDGTESNPYTNVILDSFKNTPLPIDIEQLKQVPDQYKGVISKILPTDKDSITLFDFAQHFISFAQELHNDNKAYSDLRNFINNNFNKGQFEAVEDSIDFNENFKNSPLKKTFLDYVKDCLQPNGEPIPYYDYFLMSYSLLDSFGISKDKLKTRNGYTNISNNGQHSYYARFCDYLITEDKGLLSKAKIMYELNDITTNIVTVNEFLEILPIVGKNTEIHIDDFFQKLSLDCTSGKRSEPVLTKDNTVFVDVEINHLYFNIFDQFGIEVLEDGDLYFVLSKSYKNYLSSPMFRERESLVNNCINFFGMDIQGKGFFNFETEIEEMKDNIWIGRLWKCEEFFMFLHHIDTAGFSMQIGPFKTK